ncbi:anti-sigma factor [Microlunatus flavus]|uniref:Anti-sigma-K factor rskA n=1 Tax=Microlunatus flavus TaxID=1036181 RepID=A0A1H9N4J2_9ACTN|nr:anti-sigma factor [Microlunatus flavus]SER30731.1 Anti-sigma-K factor rskA [Microlunatus flavus]
MDHLSADRLATLATDVAAAPEPHEGEHLASCRACRDDVAELADLAHAVRDLGPATLRPPHPDVWAAITSEVDAAPVGTSGASPLRRRRVWVPAAVAAAVGLVVGAGAVLGVSAIRADDDGGGGGALVARADLAALPGQTGEGTAELVRRSDTLQLRVHAALQPSPGSDYHEVWLINGDGRRMYALGALPSSGDASYWLPGPLSQQLDGYSTVDISLEPDDGDTVHSQHSLVRGTLPG